MNLHKQLCLKVLEAMGLRNYNGTWKDGADAMIYSTYCAFWVCWASKCNAPGSCFKEVSTAPGLLGLLIDVPGEIGSEEDEEILFQSWRKCSACLDTSKRLSREYTEWCVQQLGTLLALPPVQKLKK
jgi:hypothetical protein